MQRVVPNNVAGSCVEMLRAFGKTFTLALVVALVLASLVKTRL